MSVQDISECHYRDNDIKDVWVYTLISLNLSPKKIDYDIV